MNTARDALAKAVPAAYGMDIAASRLLTPWLAAAIVVDKAGAGIGKVIKYLFAGTDPEEEGREGWAVDDVQACFGTVIGPHFQNDRDFKLRLEYERQRLATMAKLFRSLMRKRTNWRYCQHRDVVTDILKDVRAIRLDFDGPHGIVYLCNENQFFRFRQACGNSGFRVGRRNEMDGFEAEFRSPLPNWDTEGMPANQTERPQVRVFGGNSMSLHATSDGTTFLDVLDATTNVTNA